MSISLPKISVDSTCLPLLRLGEALPQIAGADELSIVITDGHAAPLSGVGRDLLAAIKDICPVPRHVHLIAARPEYHIDTLAAAGCERLTFQVEGVHHMHRIVGQIRAAGLSPGVAISPTTPLTRLDYLLEGADRVLLLGVEPGDAKGSAREALFERVKLLAENVRYRELRLEISVAGGLDARGMARAVRLGAQRLTVDGHTPDWNSLLDSEKALAAFEASLTLALQTG